MSSTSYSAVLFVSGFECLIKGDGEQMLLYSLNDSDHFNYPSFIILLQLFFQVDTLIYSIKCLFFFFNSTFNQNTCLQV